MESNSQILPQTKKEEKVPIVLSSFDFYGLLATLDVPDVIAEYGCFPRCVGRGCWYCDTARRHEYEQEQCNVRAVQRHLRAMKIAKMRLSQPSWCTSKSRKKKIQI